MADTMLYDLYLIKPEIWILSLTCIILLLQLFVSKRFPGLGYLLTLGTLIGGALLSLQLLADLGFTQNFAFNNMFVADGVSLILKVLICCFALFVFIYARKYLEEHHIPSHEYYVLSLFSILGMMILVSASSLLTLYLGLELLSLPLYALIAMAKEEHKAAEAAMKYFVMGALASGMFLYGISLIYGVTGSLELSEISKALAVEASHPHLGVIFALIFILVGLAFKFGAVPFHMWIPDVYQGSPTSVTLFIATLPKLTGFGMAYRLLVETFPHLQGQWQPVFIVMSIASLALGNLGAIAQTNLKRLLAYSTIGHVGYIFLGFLAGPISGYAAVFAYIIIYTLMVFSAFALIIALSHQYFESDSIADFRGLGKTQPFVAFLMLLTMFSLAGVPPLVGFYAKFIVLNAVIQAGYLWLAVIAVIFSVIGAYYYLKLVRVMFFEEPLHLPPQRVIAISDPGLVILSMNGLALLVFGIYPTPIINLCLKIVQPTL